MAFVRYEAKRSLIAGHVAGTQYEIEFSIRSARRSRASVTQANRSFAGDRETLYFRADEVWSVETTLVDESNLDAWREFLDSVEDGESFQLDVGGSVASPGEVMNGFIEGRPAENRAEPNWYRFRFGFGRSVVE